MQRINLKIDADATSAITTVNGATQAIKRLDEASRNMPRMLGAGGSSMPVASQLMPPSPRGINSFYGQMPAAGIMRDGTRIQNSAIDVNNVKEKLDLFAVMIEKVTADMADAVAEGDLRKQLALSETRNNLVTGQRYLEGQLKSGESEARRNSAGSQIGNTAMTMAAIPIAKAIISSLELGRSGQLARAQGDYLGADVMETKGIGGLKGTAIGTGAAGLAGIAVNLLGGGPEMGKLVSATLAPILAPLGKFFGETEGADLEKNLAYSKRYKDALPGMESFYTQFGTDINKKSADENSAEAIAWFGKATDAAFGTGHDQAYLMEAAQKRGTYGNLSGDQALSLGRQDVMWERFSGANLANIQRLGGTALRYGGDENAVQTAYAGLQASGMGKGQFDEFLNGMQRIMEEGIENGFIRGADEIAGNMTMLSKLGPLWTGEQGANRLTKINQSIASSTDLNSVGDAIVFKTANDMLKGMGEKEFKNLLGKDAVYTGTAVDTFQLMEQGLKNTDMTKALIQNVKGMGGGPMEQIGFLKEITGLNYAGAAQLLNLDPNSAEFQEKINALKVDPNNQSDSVKLQNILNKLTDTGIKTGKIHFDDTELGRLESAAAKMGAYLDSLKNPSTGNISPEVPLTLTARLGEQFPEIYAGEYNRPAVSLRGKMEALLKQELKDGTINGRQAQDVRNIFSSLNRTYTSNSKENGSDGTYKITQQEYEMIVRAIQEGFRSIGLTFNLDAP
ncbi:hypothetical protein AGMMS50268_25070 [Spirochaetia bacterium]|nr:hypothetical protein AGMMS50268_25070 [Spirochaetia bacterium]